VVTAALVLLAGALLLAGHLRDDAYLVAVALGLSLAAVVVESVQVLRARRAALVPSDAGGTVIVEDAEPDPEPEPEPEPVEAPEAAEPEPTPAQDEPAPVRLPGRTTYHRPDCPTVRGKAVTPVEAGAEPDEVLKPCGRCRPTPLDRAGAASDESR